MMFARAINEDHHEAMHSESEILEEEEEEDEDED